MGASYETGISSSPTDLLQKIAAWLVIQGWTEDLSAEDGTGWRAHLHSGALYVNLRAAENERIWPAESGFHDRGDGGYGIGLYLGDGYDADQPWHLQSGRPVRTDDTTLGSGANLPAGAVAGYHFFDDGVGNIAVVVQRAPGVFCHLGWGSALAHAGGLVDHAHFFGSSSAYRNTDDAPAQNRHGIDLSAFPPMSHGEKDSASYGSNYGDFVHSTCFVRVDAGTFDGLWLSDGNWAGVGYGYSGRFLRCALNRNAASQANCDEGKFPGWRFILDRAYQTAFAGATLLPLNVYGLTDPDARYAPLGHPASIFYSEAVGHGYSAGEIQQVGGLDFMIFPDFAVRKAA